MKCLQKKKLPKKARPSTPSSDKWDSVGAEGHTLHQLVQAVKKQFGGSTVASKRKLFTAMVTVPVVPAGISFPYDPKGDFIPTFSVRPPQTIFFAQNIDPPSFSTKLPIPGDRYGSTAQLAFCNDLLRRHFETTATSATTAKSLSPVQQALVQPFLQNAEVPSHVLRLIRKVVDEFIASPKSAESILEVVLLGPGLDRDDYRRLLNSLITEFEGATWLSTEQLQGMVHMVECAGSFYLVADDLVRILAILRTRLKNTHQQSDDYTYYLVLTISRVVDMMVEGKVKEMSRVTEYEPLSTLLKGLSRDPDMCLKHQATYALQGLLHISFDESRRDFVLQHAGNITMGLLGVASVCKLSVGEVKDGVEQLFKVADELQDVGSKATEGMQSLLGSCEDMLMGIKGSIRSGGHKVWYTALREAQEHIQKGQLADFNHLVFQAPCSREVEFQWGISQLLGEIAIDPLWDVETRRYAVDFLAQLYKLESIRNPDAAIDRRILDLLYQIGEQSDSIIANHAAISLQTLETQGTCSQRNLYKNRLTGSQHPYLPRTRLSQGQSSPMLDQVQGVPEIDRDLFTLQTTRLEGSGNALYVPPLAKPTAKSANDTLFPLMGKTIEFLTSPRQVLLLLGDSGGGKSIFTVQLEHTLWQSYKRDDPIPLHINLSTIDNPFDNMIGKRLHQLNFTTEQILELKQYRQFVVICDGYDECQLRNNLYKANLFNQKGQWQVKLVITCRTQYLGKDYRSQFLPNVEPQQQRQQQEADLFQEAFIAPFSRYQVKKYVELYVQQESTSTVVDQPRWSAGDYMDKLSTIHGLVELVSNPFLLSIAVGALSKTIQSENDISNIQLSSVRLYDTFTEQWLKRGKRKLQDRVLTSEEQTVFDSLCNAGFVEQGIIFQKKLAAAIFEHQKGNPVVEYFHFNINESDSWKTEFFGPAPEAAILREASPLISVNHHSFAHHHSFIHRSILEYLYSRSFSDPIGMGDNKSGNRSESIEFRRSLAEHPLNKNSVFEVPSILQFLAECVDSDPPFKTLLLDGIMASKKDGGVSQAAANAMSIMVKAGVPFNGADLSDVKIPGALLQGGLFDSADLRGADLTGVNLSKAWLRKANLSGAHMEGVEFEELPHLQMDSGIKSCVFSSDGKLLFACSHQCSINVYDTTTWKLKADLIGKSTLAISPRGKEFANATIYNNAEVVNIEEGEVKLELSGHTGSIESICYSPDGGFIATGSKDRTVRIWQSAGFDTVDFVDALHVLHGHIHTVTGVAFSPSGEFFASCSMDKTIRIINAKTWALMDVLYCAAPVYALAYSPDGHQLASCGQNADLRLWNTNPGNTNHLLLRGHTGTIFSMAYSPDGRRVASCGSDGTVRLWNSDSGDLFDSLPGDRYESNCIAFSPTDNLVVSGGRDTRLRMWKTGDAPSANTLNNGLINRINCVDISMNGEWTVMGCFGGAVQLCDTLTGKLGVMLKGHKSDVTGVAFSPNGEQVASSSTDKTTRLWSVSTGKLLQELDGLKRFGKGLAFKPDGTPRLVTCYEQDPSIQVWDTQSGEMLATLQGHTEEINGIIYSPIDDLIASWSDDGTVRLWCTRTNECLHVLNHSEAVLNVAYSPDGKHLISSTAGGSSWWNTQSGEHIERFWRAIDPVIFWCSYSSDGKYLATVEVEKNRFHLWDISTADSDQEGTAIFSTGIGLALQHMWRYHSKEKKMVLASIDTNLSLHVRELTEGVSGRDGKGDRLSYSDVRLMWNVGEGELSMEDAILEELVGVSGPNLRLMTQRADGAEKMVWSERSTEAYFQKWGYFDSSDEEEEEEEEPAENGKGKDKEEKEKENEKEKKEKKEKENEENENENEKKVKVTMKEPDESTSDAGMARALMKRVGTIKRAETIKRAVNDMQAEAMPPVSTIRRAITMPRQSTIERTSTMPRIPIQRASTIPQEGSIEQEEGTMKRARPLKRGASNLKLVQ